MRYLLGALLAAACSSYRPATVNAPAPSSAPSPMASWSPEKAFDVSLSVSLLGPPGLGLVYGPAIGLAAGGQNGRAAAGVLIRAGLLVVPFVALGAASRGNLEPGTATLLSGASVAAVSLSALADLLAGREAVRRARTPPPPAPPSKPKPAPKLPVPEFPLSAPASAPVQ